MQNRRTCLTGGRPQAIRSKRWFLNLPRATWFRIPSTIPSSMNTVTSSIPFRSAEMWLRRRMKSLDLRNSQDPRPDRSRSVGRIGLGLTLKKSAELRKILAEYATADVFESFAEAFNAKYSKGEILPEEWDRVIQSAVEKAKRSVSQNALIRSKSGHVRIVGRSAVILHKRYSMLILPG